MKRLRLSVLLTVVMLASVTSTAGPASAEDTDVTADVFGEPLQEFLQSYPEARPLGNGSYELAPGMILSPPGALSDIGIAEYPNCPDHWFCVFQDIEFNGWSTSFYHCQTVTLAAEHRNAISSMHNAQNSLVAMFWDMDSSIGAKLGPNSWWRDMTRNQAPDGDNWNDRIDEVDPC